MEYKNSINLCRKRSLSIFYTIFLVFNTVAFVTCLKNQIQKSQIVVNVNPEMLELMEVPDICLTLQVEGSGSPQEGESPYDLVVQSIAPSVFEVIIQGKSGQLFTDFVLAVEPPYKAEFSQENFETYNCDPNHPERKTLIRPRKRDRKTRKRQVLAHFYPRNGKGTVRFRGSVYLNETTFWYIENNNLRLPARTL